MSMTDREAAAKVAALRSVANCFRHVDGDDWAYLLGKLGWGGRDRFWRCVFEELRPALRELREPASTTQDPTDDR